MHAIYIHLMRELIMSSHFYDYYSSLPLVVQEKFDYVMQILIEQSVVSTKFVKRIQKSKLYEMRVSVGSNEYRTLLFAIDNENIINASKIYLLNAFLKKSTKEYKYQIKIAQNILNSSTYE